MAVSTRTFKYESDAGGIYNIRCSQEAVTVLANAAPTGVISDSHVDVNVGHHGQKRKKGINSRGFILERFTGTAPNQRRYTTFIPILKKATYDAFVKGVDIQLQGVTWSTFDTVGEV